MKSLTKRQEVILTFIRSSIEHHRFPTSQRISESDDSCIKFYEDYYK